MNVLERLSALLSLVTVGGIAAACALVPAGPAPGPCLDDSQLCIDRRVGEVRQLVRGPDRSWIGVRASRETYVSGVRLFAYRSLKDRLTCPEIGAALADLAHARQILAGPRIAAVTVERQNQITALSEDVTSELTRLSQRKCKGS